MGGITALLSGLGAVGAVLVSIATPLFARATVSSGIKQSDDLLELAKRLQKIEAPESEEEEKVDRSKDVLAQYKTHLQNLHVIAVFGLGKLVIVTFTALVVALAFFGAAWILDNAWSYLLLFLGVIVGISVPAYFGVRARKDLDKKVKNVSDEEQEILLGHGSAAYQEN